ncbi:KH domain protein [Apiospora rasikravindrae]|uniref:KH domain protein n=1 Tax=Apiospora rasikravindrae TaxID=990691 RepID=A0ABR1U0L7_9PEZI
MRSLRPTGVLVWLPVGCQFPKQYTDGNSIKAEGRTDIVHMIVASIEAMVSERASQVSEVVDVVVENHRTLIGRGGEANYQLAAGVVFQITKSVPSWFEYLGQSVSESDAQTHENSGNTPAQTSCEPRKGREREIGPGASRRRNQEEHGLAGRRGQVPEAKHHVFEVSSVGVSVMVAVVRSSCHFQPPVLVSALQGPEVEFKRDFRPSERWLTREPTATKRGPHLKKATLPRTDPIDTLDTILGNSYHHEGSFDATVASRNVNKKYAPVEAVKTASMEAVKATPQRVRVCPDNVLGLTIEASHDCVDNDFPIENDTRAAVIPAAEHLRDTDDSKDSPTKHVPLQVTADIFPGMMESGNKREADDFAAAGFGRW